MTCDYVFPYFVREADQRGVDFSVLNNQGQAALHFATRNAYERWPFGHRNTVGRLLEIASEINVNVLSSSGSTALFYAINWLHLKEADSSISISASNFFCMEFPG